ncbi:MAG: DUF523 and DUF1722 domain-containing protein [Alcanivorax sp.]|nr:DUF523 and DUF1722 domain-containing protein [Alcanivorax sp.]
MARSRRTDSDVSQAGQAPARIPVGISACLTGQAVRHDGGHKHSRYCTEVLSRWFALRPLCPEAGAGLGTPRAAIRLEQSGASQSGGSAEAHLSEPARLPVRLIAPRDRSDHTNALHHWIDGQDDLLAGLRGFILTAKSPSCGMARIRVYNPAGQVLRRDASGLFAHALMTRYPLMPVEEAARLNDAGLRENFIERVFVYDDWCQLSARGISRAGLLAFHTRHKLQLLAHCQQGYRELGRLLSDLRVEDIHVLAAEYIARVMHVMAQPASRGAHVNVMQHMLGYFRGRLDAGLREEVQAQIQAYQREEVPLVVPLTLLRLMQRRAPDAWLAGQHYLAPYPDALGLRNQL